MEERMMQHDIYAEYIKLVKDFQTFEKNKIPLCAAETHCSPFVRSAFGSVFEGKYCMQNLEYDKKRDFIGSEYIHRLYKLLDRQCKKTFGSTYADARTLSGMNCLATVINGLLPTGGKVLLTDPEQGGHPSIPLLLELAHVSYDAIPYNYEIYDIDYEKLSELKKNNIYDAIIIAQSDLLIPANVSRISQDNTPIIYDATQTLGMIASHVHNNPLNDSENLLLIGGTHKTLPGPCCGLILTRNMEYAKKLDSFISPSYLRNTQPDHIAAVLLALIEQEQIGESQQQKTISTANYLAKKLKEQEFNVLSLSKDQYTKTHQIFLSTTKEEKDRLVDNAFKYGITLNGKFKRLFKGHGVRLGMQEISRFDWDEEELDILSFLFGLLSQKHPDEATIIKTKEALIRKKRASY